jgi:hypothetical protein
MKRFLYLVLIPILFSGVQGCSSIFHQGDSDSRRLSRTVLSVIRESVFEVVVRKPAADSLTYAAPLPTDLLPFAMRNDPYYSIGTAFAVSSDRFVSCAHVVNLDDASQNPEYYLRDYSGEVFEVDSVFAYDDNRDYIVFTVKNKSVSRWLATRADVQLNEDVFAVGNAFGEGVIIRDGVYTSRTPEAENGRWHWIRFSAAASPGNSGGPLLDRQGRIIGLISRKSENENLNYALPVGLVLSDTGGKALLHRKSTYSFPVIRTNTAQLLEWTTPLPENYLALRAKIVKRMHAFYGEMLSALLESNRASIFPNGAGSEDLLRSNIKAFFPNLIAQKEDGTWSCFEAGKINSSKLGSNGKLQYADVSRYTFFNLNRPDNVTLSALYGDSKLFMDLFLKGATLNRPIASSQTRIVSLGKAKEDYVRSDAWGRKWMVRTWVQEYNDTKVIVYALPVPEGFAGMLRIASTDSIDSDERLDLDALCDFVHLSYYGTFSQWDEYFRSCTILPAQLAAVHYSFEKDASLAVSTARVSLGLDRSVMNLTDEGDLSFRFAFFRQNGRVVYDIGGMVIGEAAGRDDIVSVFRTAHPSGKDDEWKKIFSSAHPYDAVPYLYNDLTYAAKMHSIYDADPDKGKRDFLYVVKCIVEGKVDPAVVKNRLLKFESMMTINEK